MNADSIDSINANQIDEIVPIDDERNADEHNQQQLVKVKSNSGYRKTFFKHINNDDFNHDNEIVLIEDVNSLELIPSSKLKSFFIFITTIKIFISNLNFINIRL